MAAGNWMTLPSLKSFCAGRVVGFCGLAIVRYLTWIVMLIISTNYLASLKTYPPCSG